MNSRERVIKTLKFEEVDRFPRHLWALPGVSMFRQNELEELKKRFPEDIIAPVFRYGASKHSRGNPAEVGQYTDAWGSVWQVGEPGVVGEVKEYPLMEWSALNHYRLPWELLEMADWTQVNRGCQETDKFVLTCTEARPFERMQFLRGTENLMMDLAYGNQEVYKLRDMLQAICWKNCILGRD